MKIVFDIPDETMALTNVFYVKEASGRTEIWSWTIVPKDGVEYSVVENPDGSHGVVESVKNDEKIMQDSNVAEKDLSETEGE